MRNTLVDQQSGPAEATTRFLRREQVLGKISCGRSTLSKMIKEDGFPESICISSGTQVWLESEVDQWMLARWNQAR